MTDPIDDSKITPEEAGAMQKGEGETPEEPVVEPKVETPEEPKEEPVVEPTEEPEKPLPTKRSIYEDYKEKKAEAKQAKEEVAIKDAEIARLSQELDALKQAKDDAKTPAERQAVDDEIAAFAESIGADPEAIAGLIPILEKRIGKKGESEISKEDIEFLKKVKAEQRTASEQLAFNNEWDTFVPSLKAEFPEVSDADLVNIRKEVDRLAHTPEFHDKEIDYIYFKQKNSLAKLVSPKRPSAEGTGNAHVAEPNTNVQLSGSSTPMDVQNALSRDSRPSELEVRQGN